MHLSHGSALALLALLTACGDKEGDKDGSGSGDTAEDSGVVEDTVCSRLGLPVREFDPTEPTALSRHEPAGDWSVPLRDGTTWTLSENWSGCEVYLFIPHWIPVSALNQESYWTTGVEELIERSPLNAHYFFVVAGDSAADAESYGADMEERIGEALASLSDDDAAWWADRLHVVSVPSDEMDRPLSAAFTVSFGVYGVGVDREQKLRTLGSFAAIEAYSSQLNSAGEWPWEQRVYPAALEVKYFNFEAERQAALDAVDATVVEVFGGDVIEEYEDGTLSLPDAATMAGFDTLEIDVRMECPSEQSAEIGNCGAWDYLAHMYLYDEATKSWLEMGRFITTYHRESRWVLDASHALAWLQDGGDRTIRYSWAPSWNTQPTGVTLQVRLSNQGKGAAPREALPLFTGGSFTSTYNDREPVSVDIPPDAEKVELVRIITGHGGDASTNCAEFCRQSHHFTVGSETYVSEFNEPGIQDACELTVETGTVPNQAGTWWLGRGGWCPGRRVDPLVDDVTAQVTPGAAVEVSYEGKYNGGEPVDGSGNIVMNSWLIIHR